MASEIGHPDAILVRSAKMHDMEIPGVGAGGGSGRRRREQHPGGQTFEARRRRSSTRPGANANAVKELVLAGMLLAARNLCQAWQFAQQLQGEGAALDKAVEAGKKKFVGFELPSRTLGVVGLGAIGVQVANAALALGMRVIGFDPQITVERAWELSVRRREGAQPRRTVQPGRHHHRARAARRRHTPPDQRGAHSPDAGQGAWC